MGRRGVVLSGGARTPYVLNETAAFVFAQLEEASGLHDMVERVRGRFSGRRAAIARDTLTLVEDLERRGLVEKAGWPGPRGPRR
jgi:hypothetical protein